MKSKYPVLIVSTWYLSLFKLRQFVFLKLFSLDLGDNRSVTVVHKLF